MSLESRIEALIFASDEPLTLPRLRALLGEDVRSADIRDALARLRAHYADRGIRLIEVAGGWQFRSAPELAELVHQLWKTRPPRLSRSMLETLAIIAYRQPVTRAEIEALRGVKVSSSMMSALQERGWVKVLGRKEVPGRPHLYGTGKAFLVDFGLKSLADLPEIAELVDQDEIAAAEAEIEAEIHAHAETTTEADAREPTKLETTSTEATTDEPPADA